MAITQIDAPIRLDDLDAIVPFVQRLEDFDLAKIAVRWPGFRDDNGEVILDIHGEYHPIMSELLAALYDHGFVRDFDWMKWQPRAERLYEHPELLKKARMLTCVKLLTLHARRDRFVDGHFASMVQCGHITAILRRMRDLGSASSNRT